MVEMDELLVTIMVLQVQLFLEIGQSFKIIRLIIKLCYYKEHCCLAT